MLLWLIPVLLLLVACVIHVLIYLALVFYPCFFSKSQMADRGARVPNTGVDKGHMMSFQNVKNGAIGLADMALVSSQWTTLLAVSKSPRHNGYFGAAIALASISLMMMLLIAILLLITSLNLSRSICGCELRVFEHRTPRRKSGKKQNGSGSRRDSTQEGQAVDTSRSSDPADNDESSAGQTDVDLESGVDPNAPQAITNKAWVLQTVIILLVFLQLFVTAGLSAVVPYVSTP